MPQRRIAWLAALFCFSAAWLSPDAIRADDAVGPTAYLDDAALWIAAIGTPDEARVYGALDDDGRREAFLHAFWRARGVADPADSARDDRPQAWERARRFHLRFLDARVLFENLGAAQARAYLGSGPPAREVAFGGCRGIVRPVRLWWYDEHQAADLSSANAGSGYWRAFVRDYAAPGDFRDWWPGDGVEKLSEDDTPFPRDTVRQVVDLSRDGQCFRKGESEAKRVETALRGAWSAQRVERLIRSDAPDPSWLDDFAAELPAAGETPEDGSLSNSDLDAERQGTVFVDTVFVNGVSLDLRAAGSDGSETIVRGRLTVPWSMLHRNGGGRVFDRLTVRGEVLAGAEAVDVFEHVFHLVGAPPADPEHAGVELDVWRRLRPRDYRVRWRLEDAAGRALLRAERYVQVPRRDEPAPTLHGHAMGLAGLSRDRIDSLVTFPQLHVVSPGEAQVGVVDIEVRASGADAWRPIERVDLWLDGRHAGSDDGPPWSVAVDLGPEPATHAVEAVAYDGEGRELARDAQRLDPGPRPFRVELTVDGEDAATIARVSVQLPRDEGEAMAAERAQVDKVEILVGDRLVAAFRRPPFRAELPAALLASRDATFVRAVTRLGDGRVAEDFHFLHGQGVESVDVRLVELWATVLDRRGRPVTRLGKGDFRVLDEGRPQRLQRAEMVTDLPIRVALLMDTSTSMRDEMQVAVSSARKFFDQVVTPRDAAALLTFDHRLRLRTPFTSDPSRLALGAAGLEADGGTRLHDALVWATGYLGGSFGADGEASDTEPVDTERRALVVLSDGADVGSSAHFTEALEQAVASGVAVYPILLAVNDRGTRSSLVRLARESGGSAYSVDDAGDLDWVYGRIEEELRSQYLLVYPSPGERRGTFRRVEVEMVGEGLEARTVKGYYR